MSHHYHHHHGQVGRNVSTTSMLGVPLLLSNVASTAAAMATIASVASTAHQYYKGYKMGKQVMETVNGYTQPLMSAFGLSAAHETGNRDTSEILTSAPSYVMGSTLLWNGWELISKTLQNSHGKEMQQKIQWTNAFQLKRAMASVGGKQTWQQWKKKQVSPTFLTNLPMETKIILGSFLMALASNLHYHGAEMMVKNTKAMQTDLQYPREAGAKDWLERICYNLYLSNDYYTLEGRDVPYWSSPMNWHPVRVVANIMIGMLYQIGIIGTDAGDPVKIFVKSAKVIGYWEVLAQLIGVYGWAPVFMATHWLAESILP